MPNALEFQSEANRNGDFVCSQLKLEMTIQKEMIRRKKFLSGIVWRRCEFWPLFLYHWQLQLLFKIQMLMGDNYLLCHTLISRALHMPAFFFFISSPFVFWFQNLIHLWANHSFTDQIYGSVLMVFFFDLSRSIFVSAWGFQFRSLVSLIFGAGAKRPWNYGVVSTIQQPGNSHCHKTTVINKNHIK